MAVKTISRSQRVGEAFEVLPAGTYDLAARPNKPQACARALVVLVAGTITMLKDSGGFDSPPGAVFQGLQIQADMGDITIAGGATVMVFW